MSRGFDKLWVEALNFVYDLQCEDTIRIVVSFWRRKKHEIVWLLYGPRVVSIYNVSLLKKGPKSKTLEMNWGGECEMVLNDLFFMK